MDRFKGGRSDIPRPEGIAIDNEGYIYVVCEETQQLYVYAPKSG
ncbi:MAG: SdiA-regulated domain-containing protein [Planctomycetota bacterium]